MNPALFEHENYRAFLKAQLAERVAANDGYSLRGFARKLSVSPSFLSEVLTGKKKLSADGALKIALRLELTEAESRYFCLLTQLEAEENPAMRGALQAKLSEINPKRRTMDLSVDVFKTISDWHHFAILELTFLHDFELTPASAAARLGITKIEAEVAIERLLRLELLERIGAGARARLRKTQGYVLARSNSHNTALKNYHRQLLQKALTALDAQDPSTRVSSSDIVPIDSKYVNEVRRLSDEFTAALIKIGEKSRVRNKVYCLSVHFFDLTCERKKP